MSSEFTLDIQLTELGFSSWNFPLCEPQNAKETFLPAQTSTDKSETETLATCQEDALILPSASAEQSCLDDHQYSCPITQSSTPNTKTTQDDSKVPTTENREKSVRYGLRSGKRKERAEQNNDDEERSREEGRKKRERHSSEGREEAVSSEMDDCISGEESIDEDTDYYELTEDDEEDEISCSESFSETNGSVENGENRCHVCDLTFSSVFLLREHLNMHTGVRPYRCDECGKQFCQLVNYRTHLRSHSQKSSIHCRVCSIIFETEEQLHKHLETNHFEKEFYQCDFCKQIFTDLDVCKDHVEVHRQQAKRYLCLKCGASFRHRKSLLRHLEWHSRGVFFCSDCDRTFSSKASLLRHSFSHLGVLPYTCLKCKRHFRLPSLYRNHECKPESIQCMACLVFFQSQEDFDRHKKDTGCWGQQGALPAKTIRCMECGQVFANVEELKKHGTTHQRVLKCAECGMGFRSSFMLMSHMGGHAGQRPCLCKDCGMGFPHQQGYDSHLKTCGLAAVKKPRLKVPNASQRIKPIAPNIVFQTVSQGSKTATFSHGTQGAYVASFGDQKNPAEGVWKLTLDKQPPPGMPLVMLLPVPTTQCSSTSNPTKNSQNLLTSSIVLNTPSSVPHVVSMPVVPPSPVVSTETGKDTVEQCRTDTQANILIPLESKDSTSKKRWTILEDKSSVDSSVCTPNIAEVGEQIGGGEVNQILNIAAQLKTKNEQQSQATTKSVYPEAPLHSVKVKEKINDGKDNIMQQSSGLKDHDVSLAMTGEESRVPLKIKAESKMLGSVPAASFSPVPSSSEITFEKDPLKKVSKDQRFCQESVSADRMCLKSEMEFTSAGTKSEEKLHGGNASAFDVEVEINEEIDLGSMEVEIGDEDSGVDMLEGELHECVTCGKVLPEKEMIQHYMKHAARSPRLSPKRVSLSTDQSLSSTSPCSPTSKKQESGTEL